MFIRSTSFSSMVLEKQINQLCAFGARRSKAALIIGALISALEK